jgi:hypothetical protein
MTHEHINPDRFADSAGVPWEGRHFESNRWANDDGSADPALLAAIDGFQAALKSGDSAGLAPSPETVIDALRNARLLIPLIAALGESGEGAHGQTVDKSADLSIVSVQTPDGQVGLPVFSCVQTMQAWNKLARPVPIEATRVALAAASEGNTRIVLDPGSPSEFVIRRPAIEAIAREVGWIHPAADAVVKSEIAMAIDEEPIVENFAVQNGDPQARLANAEVLVYLKLAAGNLQPTKQDLDDMVSRITKTWADSEIIASKVDSLAIKLVG